jgi:glycosyltransferase involved in cell wall biosynthesis
MFGGQHYLDQSLWRRKLSAWVARRTDLFLAQTKSLVAEAQADGVAAVKWLPTSRSIHPGPRPPPPAEGHPLRFVYVGQIRQCKGINELLDAALQCGSSAQLDVYGEFYDAYSEETFKNRANVVYRGKLPPDCVVETLKQYHALVLPSYHPGEGYPGVIIEAFAAGIPVVCTRWRSLPELVDETCGILVEPQDAESLRRAMLQLAMDRKLRSSLAENAWKRRDLYDIKLWAGRFLEYCREAVN